MLSLTEWGTSNYCADKVPCNDMCVCVNHYDISTEISYSRRDDHASPSSDTPLQPPSANPEAWPMPTPQGQIHPVKQNIDTTGVRYSPGASF